MVSWQGAGLHSWAPLVVGMGWLLSSMMLLQCLWICWCWCSASFCVCWPLMSLREVLGDDWISGGLGKLAWIHSPVMGSQGIGELAGGGLLTGHLLPLLWALGAVSMPFLHHLRVVLVAQYGGFILLAWWVVRVWKVEVVLGLLWSVGKLARKGYVLTSAAHSPCLPHFHWRQHLCWHWRPGCRCQG